VVEVVFWVAVGLIVYTHVGYPLLLALLARLRRPPRWRPAELPHVALVVAAHDEREVIEGRVRNALELEYPRERLEVIVASDGSTDGTAGLARAAAQGDARVEVMDLDRRGKVRAQDTAVDSASAEILAFSDANALWERDALQALVRPFSDPEVGYVCGRLAYLAPDGSNQEGVYWRYEMWLRAHESALGSITAGNGAIYAVRRVAYLHVGAVMGHDLSFPYNIVRRGHRAVYVPEARATEKMVPTIEGEGARKRRMMSHAWAIVLRGGLLDPRGYSPLYALMLLSHRVLRYASPLLHLAAAASTLALLRAGPAYRAAALAQAGLLAAAAAGGRVRLRPLLLARYYVATTGALGAGLYDHLRHGTPAVWEAAEGTR
jgi:cellulose synthase/poly-beta-1,6-N-acetylglucosamine synthase-like glycosyltransferase